jgi:hypothetical protein
MRATLTARTQTPQLPGVPHHTAEPPKRTMSLLDPAGEVFKSFTVGCAVVLQNLSTEKYNGQRGLVTAPLNESGRQRVRIDVDDKIISVKPINLSYAPCDISSLSVEEMRYALRGPIWLTNPMLRHFEKDSSNVQMRGIGGMIASIVGRNDSLVKIACADKEELVSMMTDLLRTYSVDLASYLAILRRKEQLDAIREGAIGNCMVPPSLRANEERPRSTTHTIFVSPDEPLDDDFIRKSAHVRHHKRCTDDEIEYIIRQQEYYAKNQAELLCLSSKSPSMLSVLDLYERHKTLSPSLQCRFCGKIETMNESFGECGACGSNAVYCSKQCQKADWKKHKKVCQKVPEGEQKEERRLDKRLDRFVHLYGQLLHCAITDMYAKKAKELGIDSETISNSHIVTVHLTDLSPKTAIRPYLHLSSIDISEQEDQSEDAKRLIKTCNARRPHAAFRYVITHEGYGGRGLHYSFPVDKEFGYLVEYCNANKIAESMDVKIHTINELAAGWHPSLYNAIVKTLDLKARFN